MKQTVWNYRIRSSCFWATAALVALLPAASCRKSKNVAETTPRKTFASPEEAGAAVVAAAKAGDKSTLIEIFGPDSKTVLMGPDANADKARLNDFVTAYNQMHRWSDVTAGGKVLQVGADNYVFPIPLGQNSSGRWYFDTGAGKDEVLARRVGKNELTAMDASEALGAAERQYYRQGHDGDKVKQYAQKFVSDPGRHNGLLWPVAEGQAPSPLGRFGDFAKAQSSTKDSNTAEFNGYRYRILNKTATPSGVKDCIVNGKMTGGFAILAYPSEYRTSGIMSFMVGEDGTLYQKDLGEHTTEVAAAITDYNPADGWAPLNATAPSASRTRQ